MNPTTFRLLLSLVCVFIVWGTMILAGFMASLLPDGWRLLPVVLPVGVIVLVGAAAAHHWWTWGSSLIAAPLVAFGMYSLVEALRSPDGTRYHSYAVGFAAAGIGYGLALAVLAMALAGLGVVIGQRLHGIDRDDVDPGPVAATPVSRMPTRQ